MRELFEKGVEGYGLATLGWRLLLHDSSKKEAFVSICLMKDGTDFGS